MSGDGDEKRGGLPRIIADASGAPIRAAAAAADGYYRFFRPEAKTPAKKVGRPRTRIAPQYLPQRVDVPTTLFAPQAALYVADVETPQPFRRDPLLGLRTTGAADRSQAFAQWASQMPPTFRPAPADVYGVTFDSSEGRRGRGRLTERVPRAFSSTIAGRPGVEIVYPNVEEAMAAEEAHQTYLASNPTPTAPAVPSSFRTWRGIDPLNFDESKLQVQIPQSAGVNVDNDSILYPQESPENAQLRRSVVDADARALATSVRQRNIAQSGAGVAAGRKILQYPLLVKRLDGTPVIILYGGPGELYLRSYNAEQDSFLTSVDAKKAYREETDGKSINPILIPGAAGAPAAPLTKEMVDSMRPKAGLIEVTEDTGGVLDYRMFINLQRTGTDPSEEQLEEYVGYSRYLNALENRLQRETEAAAAAIGDDQRGGVLDL
jgi:hypothetical protein